MVREIENFLNCREHFLNNIEMLKEAFIKYYGEERREEIEEKFGKALFVAYRGPDSTAHFLRELREFFSTEIVDKKLGEVETSLSKKDIFGSYGLDSPSILPITYYQDFYELYELGPEGRVEKFKKDSLVQIRKTLPEFTEEEYEEMIRTQTIPEKYSQIRLWMKDNLRYYSDLGNAERAYERAFDRAKELLHKVDPDITADNFSYYFDQPDIEALTSLATSLPDMIGEFENKMSKYEAYQREDDIQKEIKKQLEDKYYLKWIEENIDLLKEEDRRQVEVYHRDPSKKYELTGYTTYLFGYSMTSNHPLDAFTKESNQILENEEESDWKRKSIRDNRVEYFKRNGLDLGDDYEAYAKSEEAKKLWPSREVIAKFVESRNRLLNEFNNEYYTSLPAHKEIREELDSHHLLDKEDSFNASLYTKPNGTFVNPNLVKTEDGYDLFSLVAICCNNNSGDIDHNIVHELNHLFELSLSKVEEDHYEVICGWDVINGTINQRERKPVDTLTEDKTKRSYELFSEIINELIAQEICEILQQEKKHVFDTEENAKIRHTTSYEHTFFLVRDFFQEFKKEIIESRSNGNIEVIWNKVGKENFDELNELFHVFFEHFQGFKVYSLMQSLKNKEDTQQTRIYYDLVEKRDKILEKMRKHSMLTEAAEEEKKEEKKKPTKRGRKKKEKK